MRGSIDKRADQVYRIRLHLGYDGGKRITHTETVHGTKKEAEARMRDLIRDHERGSLTKRSGKSLNEFLADWLIVAKAKVRQRTWQEYEALCARYIKEDLGRLPLDSLSPLRIQKTYQGLTDRGLSPLTVRRLHTVLNQALRQAVRWKMLPHNPAADVELPRRKARRVQRAFTLEQALAFIDACREHRWGTVLIFALLTGMRPEEYLALFWSDIDQQAGAVSISRVLVRPKGGGWFFEEPKTESSRRLVALDPKVLRELRAHRARQLQERLVSGERWDSTHDFVFTNELGGPISTTHLLLRAFKPLLKKAGIPTEFRLYDLRHSHATLLLQMGEAAKIVSERLGHSGIAITLDVYSHVLPQMQKETARKVGEMLL